MLYWQGRTRFVKCWGCNSTQRCVLDGIAQGSVQRYASQMLLPGSIPVDFGSTLIKLKSFGGCQFVTDNRLLTSLCLSFLSDSVKLVHSVHKLGATISTTVRLWQSFLAGMSGSFLNCMLLMMNAAAHLIFDSWKWDHASPPHNDLRWMLAHQWTDVKIAARILQMSKWACADIASP